MDLRFQSLFDGCLEIDPSKAASDLVKTIPSGRGILLFADASNRPIQLLSTASMRAAATTRLAPQVFDGPTRRADLSAVIASVYFVSTFCEFRSLLRYREIAIELYPNDYRRMLNLSRPLVAAVDTAEAWPSFHITQKVITSTSLRSFGPFPTRKAAALFADALNNAFLLCRNPGLADNPDKARSCPYLQMKTCPAPCVGASSREDYRQRLETALRAASGERQCLIEEMKSRMLSLASERLFEQANQLKTSIQNLESLAGEDYRWTTDLTKLRILHIDRSRRVKVAGSRKLEQSYALFVIRPGCIEELPEAILSEISAVLEKRGERDVDTTEPFMSDSLSMIQSLLYRSTPPGILLRLQDASSDLIEALIAERYARHSGDVQ